MHFKSILIAAAMSLQASSVAFAANNTFQPSGATGSWNTAGNWSQSHVPTESENVIIPTGKTAQLDTTPGVADSLEVTGTGKIEISGVSLTVDGDSDAVHNLNGGTIKLMDSTAKLLFTERTHQIATTSSGAIEGFDNSALIDDDDPMTPRTLTINASVTIKGRLEIELYLDNDGVVNADVASTTIKLSAGAEGAGDFKATADQAMLWFAAGTFTASGMDADLYVNAGGIAQFDVDFTTDGCLEDFSGYGGSSGIGSKIDINSSSASLKFLCTITP